MKDPMKSIPFLPKIVPGVGWGRVGWDGVGCVMQGWGGVGWCGVCHTGHDGVGVSCRGGVGCVMQGWGGVGHVGVGWVMQG